MAKEKRVSCPYNQSRYDDFHNVCPLNGEPECVNYQVIEECISEVDQAYGEYQRR